MLQRTWTDGFLLLHKGQIVSEQYFNGMTSSTLHLMMSCSKSFTSSAVGIAIAEGALDPEQPLTYYLPELADSGVTNATVQNALDMRVGLKFDEDYTNLDGDWRDCEIATGWREPAKDYTGPLDMVGYLRSLTESVGPNDGDFHYQSILSDAVGLCLERATGQSFLKYFRDRIWEPLGAEQDLVSIVDANGTAVFEGGFNCCLRDFARFANLFSDGGKVHGTQVVPSRWVDECRFPPEDCFRGFPADGAGSDSPKQGYHNQWWIKEPERGVVMALGIHGQILYVDSQREFVVAKFSSQPAHSDPALLADQVRAFESLSEFVAD